MIKRSYINDGGQKHAKCKLNVDEEPDGSKTPTGAHTLRAFSRVKHTNMDEDTSSETPMDAYTLRVLNRVKYTNMDKDTITFNFLIDKVCSIIAKEKENVQPITGKDAIFISTNGIIHLLNLLLL